ncbi:MAG: hypothetical protein IKX56_02290, partial [Muribaculaceae bacterium]|nr:hypothetical protein [Muribaculaceae bacterium]
KNGLTVTVDANSVTIPEGYTFIGITVTPNTVTVTDNHDGTYSFTMPAADVTVSATLIAPEPVTYLDENGVEQQCTNYTILTNTITTIGSADHETWYVADGTINFNQTINVNGVVHLILKDNAVMNVGTNESPITGRGISSSGPSISIYGQSTGSDIGMLSVYATYCGIYDYDYYGNNNNPNYDYAVTINGGKIFVSAYSYGIQSNKVTINGGQVSATAGICGIFSFPNAITLGWTSPYDFIFANNYQGDVIVKEGKTFITDDATPIQVSDTISDLSTINGKTLYPYVAITKSIIGYSQGGGWYLIASPVADAVMPTEANGILSNENEFDLYRFNPLNEGNEWENYKANSFTLVNGQGYLYASSDTTTLVFAGVPVAGHTYEIELEYDANDEHKCWNLVGNPFDTTATLDRDYYILSTDGTGINPVAIPATTPIPPCTAVFVKAVSAGDTAVFTKVTQ